MQVSSDSADVFETITVTGDFDALRAAKPGDIPGEQRDCFEEDGPLAWVVVCYLWEYRGWVCGFLGRSGG